MKIFNMIQAHLDQLANHDLYTLAQRKKFKFESVTSLTEEQNGWYVSLLVGQYGNTTPLYITDILRVYTWMVSEHWNSWVNITDMSKFIFECCINKQDASYMMSILATFDDIEKKEGRDAAIRFASKQ